MKKKGVSPVIASVLLIGMVVALALIIFIWMRGFTQEVITKFDGQNVELSCENIQLDASYSSGELSISNRGNVPVFNAKLKVSSVSGTVTKNLRDSSEDWPRYGLNPGDAFLGNIEGLSGDKIILIPLLLGNSENGKKLFSCEESKYGITL